MLHIEMSVDEARVLRKILDSHLAELKIEMASTRIDEFAETLRREEQCVENLLRRLEREDFSLPDSAKGEYGG